MINKFRKTGLLVLTAALIVSLISCNPAAKYEKSERESIDNFLHSNDTLSFDLKPSGLYYHEEVAGTGRTPQVHDTAYVYYTGKFLNGTVFDTNTGTGGKVLSFPIGEGLMISGFDEGIIYMKEGGKALLVLPSKLAYGTQGWYTIPGYTALQFELQLVKVVPGSSK
jgi:FKBP-type peptidyl-prolyl cis-trans isomerase FkpA